MPATDTLDSMNIFLNFIIFVIEFLWIDLDLFNSLVFSPNGFHILWFYSLMGSIAIETTQN